MKEQHPIDKHFKDRLNDHKTTPSDKVWERISSELETGSGRNRSGGWYMMRAAVVVLLVGISSLLYFQNHEVALSTVQDSVATEGPENTDTKDKKQEPAAATGKKQSEDQPEKEGSEGTRPQKKTRKAIPIVHPNNHTAPIVVSNEERMPEVDESQLYDEEEMVLTVELDPSRTEAKKEPNFKVRMKLNPATAKAFYANNEDKPAEAEEDKNIKDKVFAYATDQIDNLKSGKRLELPKTERKPQLEINLDKLF